MRRLRTPSVATMHGRMDLPDLASLYAGVPRRAAGVHLRRPARAAAGAQLAGDDPHGLPMDQIKATDQPGSYLAFLGRTSPEKGLDQAIAIARRSRLPLKVAAKVDSVDAGYFEREIRPMLTGRGRVRRRDRRGGEGRVPGSRCGRALPDRLAGALRPGDDRSRRARHAGARVRRGSVRRGHRGRASRGWWSMTSTRQWRRCQRCSACRGPRFGGRRGAILRGADGAGLRRGLRAAHDHERREDVALAYRRWAAEDHDRARGRVRLGDHERWHGSRRGAANG